MTGEICKDTLDVMVIRYRRTRAVSVKADEKETNLFFVLIDILITDNVLVMIMRNECFGLRENDYL